MKSFKIDLLKCEMNSFHLLYIEYIANAMPLLLLLLIIIIRYCMCIENEIEMQIQTLNKLFDTIE